ncbi:hypothetical protein [Schlesneria sp. T3-172]|uniref:hypothetical protein n=1 Tax=Schlesneria sphaerica TaxID=3373610 RepID=UPI0037C9C9DF
MAFAWSDFFGERLIQTLERWTDRLVRSADDCRGRLAKSLSESSEVSPSMTSSLDGILETTERIVREILEQAKLNMEGKIQHEQRTLYETVPLRVKANMQAAFDDAANESGSGMKQRMVETLATHAHRVAQVMFDDARDAILSGVRGLNDWLAREFDKMIEAVRRNVSLAADNLVAEGPRMTLQIIEAEQAILTDLMALIGSFEEEQC